MMNYTFIALVGILVILGVFCAYLYRHLRRLETTYKGVLESNQRSLDRQTARINILSRALPNLKTLLSNSSQGQMESWKSLCLDEARALIWADVANYWSYIEKDEELELDLVRGLEVSSSKGAHRIKIEEGALGQTAVQRMSILVGGKENGSEKSTGLLVPLVVSGNLWGIFEFYRHDDPPLNQRDLDLVHMFINHLALNLENREMVLNRERFYLELVQTLADVLDSRDASSEGQSRRARELARGVARELDMPEEFTYYLEFAALMHDIGKIAIDDRVLKKPGKLTDQEFELIKKHPELGHKILAPVSMLAPVAPMVLYHQEWFNGKGYPEGLSGEEIPLGARIVAILDAWGAMTCDRPWRQALTASDAIKELKKGAGSQFDPMVVDAFVATLKNQGLLGEGVRSEH